MTTEQINKEDIALFNLKNQILSQTDDYNKRLKRLEKVRPSRFAIISPSKFDKGCNGVQGIGIVYPLLDNIMI